MNFEFSFYQDTDYQELKQLVLNSYQWEYPLCGLGRLEFSRGLGPAFSGHYHAWQHTIGIYRRNQEMIACVWNEGNYDGDVFFLFRTKENAEDEMLLRYMIKFGKTYANAVGEDKRTNFVNLYVPEWNRVLQELAMQSGFARRERTEPVYILPYERQMFPVVLPDGYCFADGAATPDFYLSNTHRLSFGYGGSSRACEYGEQAFHDLRQMSHYKKDFDLCVLDELGCPVAMAMIWYDETMPYCELEPLGVVWWERRKGIATALLYELSNRVMKQYPQCRGMLGSTQEFYQRTGYRKMAETGCYHWEIEVFPSWVKESAERRYGREAGIV